MSCQLFLIGDLTAARSKATYSKPLQKTFGYIFFDEAKFSSHDDFFKCGRFLLRMWFDDPTEENKQREKMCSGTRQHFSLRRQKS